MAPRPGRRGRQPRIGAWRPVGQRARWGGGRGRKVGGLHVLGSGEGSLLSPGPGTGLGLTRPRGPSGRAWPGLQGSSAGLRKWEWSEPACGAGTGSSGSRGSCRNRGRGTGLAAPMQGGRGRPGKHVRAAGPEPGLLPSSEAWPGGEDCRGRLGGKGAAEPGGQRWASESKAELPWNRETERDRAVSSWVPDLQVAGPVTDTHTGSAGTREAPSWPASCSIWETEVPLGIHLDGSCPVV